MSDNYTHTLTALFAAMIMTVSTVFAAEPAADSRQDNPDAKLAAIKKQLNNITTDQLVALLKDKPDIFLIDVRTRDEIKNLGGEIKALNNYNIPRGWLEQRIFEIAKKDDPIVVYCGTAVRSAYAAKTLNDMGFTNVSHYADGFVEWNKRNLPKRELDRYPESVLYNKVEEVVKGTVYSSIGATSPATYENAGHNNNLSFIVTKAGVVVFNAGGSYLLAKALHEEIKAVTDQPVKYVVMENAQGHAALGMSYWQEQGVTTLMHEAAAKEWEHTASRSLESARRVQQDKSIGTRIVAPDKTFATTFDLSMGGEAMEARYIGLAHSPGDIMLIMPERKLIISGDIAFNVRMPPIFEHTDVKTWIKNWETFEAFQPGVIIPGHGGPADLATVRRFTKDYLVFLVSSIEELLDNGGGLVDIYSIDQSAFWDMDTYRELAMQNMATVYKRMEFDF